jgi:hypothetical protein
MLSVRELQTESARVLSVLDNSTDNINRFNKQAHHDSHMWYKAVIQWYVDQYGDLPSKCGPATIVKLLQDV